MNKSLIHKYIADRRENDLLDKLKGFQLEDYNLQFRNLLRVLLILIEEGTDHFGAQQFFHKVVIGVLPKILAMNNVQVEFFKFIQDSSVPPFVNTSQAIRQLIIGVIDQEISVEKFKTEFVTSDSLYEFRLRLTKLNVFFLEKAIQDQREYDVIVSLFYSAVEELRGNRRVIIDGDAVKQFRDYLTENPREYLRAFIRPLYSGGINDGWDEYFLHVPEPFYNQIFDEKDYPIEVFFKYAKRKLVQEDLINDIKKFYEKVLKSRSIDEYRSIMLKNKLAPDGLTLKSKEHRNVRPECLV